MKTRLFTLFASFCLLATALFADSAADIQRRMAQRLGALDDMKAKGAIGENNRGFVEVRASAANADSLVSAENKDREDVYALIAKQTGATPDSVGRARAKQIAAGSHSGVWVQDESGKWSKK
jgi:uncharacterized protein YdbL (DUF1318 family)